MTLYRRILSALNTPTYKLAKLIVPILKLFTTNEFTVKDSFHFAEETFDQQHDLFMGSLDVDSQFTNIPLEETTEICTNELFMKSETVEGLSKTEFKELLSLATKDSHFIFDEALHKQIVGVAIGSPPGLTLTNAFLIYHKKIGLNNVHWNIHHYTIEGMLIYLFYLIQRIILNVFIVI